MDPDPLLEAKLGPLPGLRALMFNGVQGGRSGSGSAAGGGDGPAALTAVLVNFNNVGGGRGTRPVDLPLSHPAAAVSPPDVPIGL